MTRVGIYKTGGKIRLSDLTPILRALGLTVVEEVPTRLQGGDGETFLHDFGVLDESDRPLDLAECGDRVAACIAAVWRGEAESDDLNRLVVTAGLTWREVAVQDPACEVAYTLDARATSAAVTICVESAKWASPDRYCLAGTARAADLAVPRYEHESEAVPVEHQNGRIVCRRDLAFDVYWLATGQEERHWKQAAHGVFDLDSEPAIQHDVLRQAIASQIVNVLERWLVRPGEEPPLPRWSRQEP